MVPAVAVSSLLGLRTVFQLAHHCVWFISMRSSSWMGVTGKTLQHKFNFYSILGETFGPRRHLASDKTASHKSVINHIVLLGLQPSVLWDVLRYCSDSFAQVGQLGHSFKVLEESVPKSASDPQAKAYRLEFFSANTTDWRRMAPKRSYDRSSHLSFDIFCLFLSSYCIFLSFFIFFSETRVWHQEGAGTGTPDATEQEQQEQQQKAPDGWWCDVFGAGTFFHLATQQPQEVIKCFYIRFCSILFSRFTLKFGSTQHETEPVPDGESSQRGLADTFSDCLCCSYIFEPARMQGDRSDPAFAASLFTLVCSPVFAVFNFSLWGRSAKQTDPVTGGGKAQWGFASFRSDWLCCLDFLEPVTVGK